MANIDKYNAKDSIFDDLRRVDENGNEYWTSRQLWKVLEYTEYRHFLPVVEKAKIACTNSGNEISNHFEDILEMVVIGSGAERKLESVKFSRYACYLIAQNANQTNANIHEARLYFADNNTLDSGTQNKFPSLSIQDELTNFLLYTAPNGNISVEAILHNETIWLSQAQMAQVFDVQVPNISKHIKSIFESHELEEHSVVSILETTAQDGKVYSVRYYNLDAIIAVGYRVSSMRATQFRMWATQILREFIIKGFVLDDYRLKNGQYFGKDYFEDLLEQVRSIRSSERRIYQKITDIFAVCSSDYNKHAHEAMNFYAEVQNKFHYAISGHTAAEIIHSSADAEREFMGLKTFKNAPKGRVVKSDVSIAKNYLTHEEITKLDRLVGSYFDYVERLIERRTLFTMHEFADSVIKFLDFNEYRILEGKGSISAQQAKKKAEAEYDIFNKRQKIESDFDRIVKKIEGANKNKQQ